MVCAEKDVAWEYCPLCQTRRPFRTIERGEWPPPELGCIGGEAIIPADSEWADAPRYEEFSRTFSRALGRQIVRTINDAAIEIDKSIAAKDGCGCGSPRCTYPGSFHCRRGV